MENKILAQSITVGSQTIQGPLDSSFNNIGSVITKTLTFLFPLGGILLFLYLIWGGYNYLLSFGDAKKIENGKAKITAALIGFILLISSYVLTKIIATIFGLSGGGF